MEATPPHIRAMARSSVLAFGVEGAFAGFGFSGLASHRSGRLARGSVGPRCRSTVEFSQQRRLGYFRERTGQLTWGHATVDHDGSGLSRRKLLAECPQ